MTTQPPERAPATTLWPALQAHDALALIDFYVDVLGFRRTAVYADGDQVAHAQLDWPAGGGIMLGSFRPDSEWSRQPGTFGAYVVVEDVVELHARLRTAGAAIVRDLSTPDYGGLEFSVRDPEGNSWSVGDYRGAPRG